MKVVSVYLKSAVPLNLILDDKDADAIFAGYCTLRHTAQPGQFNGRTIDGCQFSFAWTEVVAVLVGPFPPQQIQLPPTPVNPLPNRPIRSGQWQ